MSMPTEYPARPRRGRSRAAEMGAAENGLVDAGQRLVDGLFGKDSGIKVREGTAEEAAEVLGEAMKWLAGQMMEGKGLAARSSASGTGKRASIGGIFTGTAADYANRSRQGGVDDGPSLQKIGSGEGSQVYAGGCTAPPCAV